MAFLDGTDQLDELKISGTYKSGVTTLGAIKMYNNNSITLDVSELVVSPADLTLQDADQVKLLKIIVEWGDGSDNETLSPILLSKESKENQEDFPWSRVTHTYNLTDKIESLQLKLYAYNTINECATLVVPITILYLSILQSGVNFRLVSANITNVNGTSYVLTDINSRVTIAVQERRIIAEPTAVIEEDNNDTGTVLPTPGQRPQDQVKPDTRPRSLPDENVIKFTFNLPAGSTEINLTDWIYFDKGSFTGKIDWGDNSLLTEIKEGNKAEVYKHIYKNPGKITIKIQGNIKMNSIGDNSGAIKACLESVDVVGICPVSEFDANVFNACVGLTKVAFSRLFNNENFGRLTNVNLQGMFEGCTALAGSLPSNLFNGFSRCQNLAQFNTTTMFHGCTKLTGYLPNALFIPLAGLAKLTYLTTTNMFNGCTGFTGNIPENLFEPFEGSPALANFVGRNMFQGCRGFNGSVGGTFFDPFFTTTNFDASYMFQDCTGLTGIDEDFGSKLRNVNTFKVEGLFLNCSNMTNSTPELWKDYPKTVHGKCFSGCKKLSNWSDIPQDWGGDPVASMQENYLALKFVFTSDKTNLDMNDWFLNPNQGYGEVEWGDGTKIEAFSRDTKEYQHVYAKAGTYTVKIRGEVTMNPLQGGMCTYTIRNTGSRRRKTLRDIWGFYRNKPIMECLKSVTVVGTSPIVALPLFDVSTIERPNSPCYVLDRDPESNGNYLNGEEVGVFGLCNALGEVEFEKLLNNPKLVKNANLNLKRAFLRCHSLKSTAPSSWWSSLNLSYHPECFRNCENIPNAADIPTGWK